MKSIIAAIFFIFCTTVQAQNTRISNHNTIGWFAYTGTIKLGKKTGLHTEYQWRRTNIVQHWQQGLVRLGFNYQLHQRLQLRLGYAWAETFAYGDIPINGFGKTFTEHRAYEMLTLSDKISIVELSHRLMLEQRWIGRYSTAALTKEDSYLFLNRLRYMLRIQVPLKGKTIGNKTPYAALYDEILLGFGKNVNENVFDQNRLGLLLGYRFNNSFRVEAGFLHQALQLGREVNNQNVFQYNSGFLLSTAFTFNANKK
jgi:hypothetical protein